MEDPAVVTVMVMLSLFSFCGNIRNSLVLYIYSHKKKQSTAGIFIMSLAGNDLFTCLFVMPFTEAVVYLNYMLRYDVACKLYMFFITYNVPFAAFIMVAIAIDRYFCICHPFQQVLNTFWAKVIVLCLLLAASTFGIITSLSDGVFLYKQIVPVNETLASRSETTMFTKNETHVQYISTERKTARDKRSNLYPSDVSHVTCLLPPYIELSNVESQFTTVSHVNPHSGRRSVTSLENNENGDIYVETPVELQSMRPTPRKGQRAISIKEKTIVANIRTAVILFVVTVVFLAAFLPAWPMGLQAIEYNANIFYMYFVYHTANPFINAFVNKSFRDDLRKTCNSCSLLLKLCRIVEIFLRGLMPYTFVLIIIRISTASERIGYSQKQTCIIVAVALACTSVLYVHIAALVTVTFAKKKQLTTANVYLVFGDENIECIMSILCENGFCFRSCLLSCYFLYNLGGIVIFNLNSITRSLQTPVTRAYACTGHVIGALLVCTSVSVTRDGQVLTVIKAGVLKIMHAVQDYNMSRELNKLWMPPLFAILANCSMFANGKEYTFFIQLIHLQVLPILDLRTLFQQRLLSILVFQTLAYMARARVRAHMSRASVKAVIRVLTAIKLFQQRLLPILVRQILACMARERVRAHMSLAPVIAVIRGQTAIKNSSRVLRSNADNTALVSTNCTEFCGKSSKYCRTLPAWYAQTPIRQHWYLRTTPSSAESAVSVVESYHLSLKTEYASLL
ncbi:CCKAR-like protein [Mya arenaria]|uniref:CCKAR-like protein n=1 Tax=Mya arenaria TaxID=6604 RepID=A0ABY7F1X5_MYAAR|nr:CCKAR-like protein [Mya arenaria]